MKHECIPNLFLVGAPKCGTTAMYSYLNEHPQIYMSPKKEPQFFAGDVLGHQRNVIAVEDYRRCFDRADGARVVGEASTAYMVSRIAAEQIKSYNPSARILVMLRNPIDVMHALHSKRLFMNMEDITDFGKAITCDDARLWRAGRWKGQPIIRPSYREVASFPAQLKRFTNVFGRDRVHVVVYDDFRSDPATEYAKLLAFLGVDPAPSRDFIRHNANRRVRNMGAQDWLRDPPGFFRRIARSVLPTQVRRTLGQTLRSVNVKYEPRAAIDPALRLHLQREFAPEVEELSQILRRDLTHWVRQAPSVGSSAA